MVVFPRKESERESGFEANMWESSREVVFHLRWDGVTERESGGWTTRVSWTTWVAAAVCR